MLLKGSVDEHYQGDEVDEQQIIFQIGLFLLDLIYEYEVYLKEKEELFVKDVPLSRNRLSYKGYLVFMENGVPELNISLVQQKLKCITFVIQIWSYWIK